MSENKSRLWRTLLLLALVLGLGGAFLAFGPPNLLAKSETPDFCASCHVMEAEYEAWFHQGAHSRKACVECHLPNDNLASHYVWKSIDGMKDVVVFNSGRVPENIKITDHGAKVVRDNCIRCHAFAVDKIAQDRNCWDCHRRVSHKLTGLR